MLKNNTNHSTISRSGSNDNVADAFQNEGILPKIETEASLFLKNYPNYDGKNVIVAVWGFFFLFFLNILTLNIFKILELILALWVFKKLVMDNQKS